MSKSGVKNHFKWICLVWHNSCLEGTASVEETHFYTMNSIHLVRHKKVLITGCAGQTSIARQHLRCLQRLQ
jgi:hypothetical protein